MSHKKSQTAKIAIVGFCACIGFAAQTFSVEAARLYFDPATSSVARGDQFSITMRADTEGECINAIEARIRFSNESLRAVDVGRGQSFLTLWVEEPNINQETGIISFTGGIPGGYCGRVAGDTGESDIIGKIIFRIPSLTVGSVILNEADITFEESTRALLNDGIGSPASLAFEKAHIVIGAGGGGGAVDEWRREIREDANTPEPFMIEVYRDEKTFGGKYFIVFSTTDKQTGIDHYEVMETDERGMLPGTDRKAQWVLAKSPYVLEDQVLSGVIHVKAVDKAGNETIASIRSEDVARRIHDAIVRSEKQRVLTALFIIVIIMLFAARIAYRMWKHRKKQKGAKFLEN